MNFSAFILINIYFGFSTLSYYAFCKSISNLQYLYRIYITHKKRQFCFYSDPTVKKTSSNQFLCSLGCYFSLYLPFISSKSESTELHLVLELVIKIQSISCLRPHVIRVKSIAMKQLVETKTNSGI